MTSDRPRLCPLCGQEKDENPYCSHSHHAVWIDCPHCTKTELNELKQLCEFHDRRSCRAKTLLNE